MSGKRKRLDRARTPENSVNSSCVTPLDSLEATKRRCLSSHSHSAEKGEKGGRDQILNIQLQLRGQRTLHFPDALFNEVCRGLEVVEIVSVFPRVCKAWQSFLVRETRWAPTLRCSFQTCLFHNLDHLLSPFPNLRVLNLDCRACRTFLFVRRMDEKRRLLGQLVAKCRFRTIKFSNNEFGCGRFPALDRGYLEEVETVREGGKGGKEEETKVKGGERTGRGHCDPISVENPGLREVNLIFVDCPDRKSQECLDRISNWKRPLNKLILKTRLGMNVFLPSSLNTLKEFWLHHQGPSNFVGLGVEAITHLFLEKFPFNWTGRSHLSNHSLVGKCCSLRKLYLESRSVLGNVPTVDLRGCPKLEKLTLGSKWIWTGLPFLVPSPSCLSNLHLKDAQDLDACLTFFQSFNLRILSCAQPWILQSKIDLRSLHTLYFHFTGVMLSCLPPNLRVLYVRYQCNHENAKGSLTQLLLPHIIFSKELHSLYLINLPPKRDDLSPDDLRNFLASANHGRVKEGRKKLTIYFHLYSPLETTPGLCDFHDPSSSASDDCKPSGFCCIQSD